jgi:hypothetical protein
VKLSAAIAIAAAVPALWLAPAPAQANSIVSAQVEATCEGFAVSVSAALGTAYQGFLDYQIDVAPAAPGTPIVRSLPIQGDASSTIVTASESVAFASPLSGSFAITGTVSLRGTSSQLAFNGGVPVALECNPARPAIRLQKQVAVPGVEGWFDANDEASAPTVLAPSDAEYRLIVINEGNVALEDVVVNDASLGLVDVAVGTIPVGEFRELTRFKPGFEALYQPNRCTKTSTIVNVADVAGRSAASTPEQPVIVTDEDPALLICTEPPSGGEGCTPGYWKQAHHFDSWVGYAPGQSYAEVFGVTPSFNKTLLGALQQGGGGQKALGRHAVAALLSAANDDVSYAFSVDEVIAIVQTAYATGNFERAKNELARENERGCPLN